ncbi:unnamed protein product, partial [marine sediment metagenome]
VTYIKHMQALDKCREIDHDEKVKMQKRQREKLKAKGLYKEGLKETKLDEMAKTEGIETETEAEEEKPKTIVKPASKAKTSDAQKGKVEIEF